MQDDVFIRQPMHLLHLQGTSFNAASVPDAVCVQRGAGVDACLRGNDGVRATQALVATNSIPPNSIS